MTQLSDFEHITAIHYRDIEKSNPSSYGNDFLKSELGKQGVGLVAIPNAAAYDLDAGTVSVLETGHGDTITLGDPIELPLGQNGLEVIRARVLTPKPLQETVDVLNGSRLRSFGASKWQQYELASEYMPRTVLVEADQPLSEGLLDTLVGDTLVVKGDTSQASQHLAIAARSEVLNTIAAMRTELDPSKANIVVQEFMPGQSWTELGLKGLDATNTELLKREGSNAELRMYCFVDAAGKVRTDDRFHGTLGVVDGEKGWVAYVDQDSIPAEAFAIAEEVSSRLLTAADVRGGFFAIDLINGPERPDGTGSIYIREINTRDPMMTETQYHAAETIVQRKKLAGLMATLTQTRPTTV